MAFRKREASLPAFSEGHRWSAITGLPQQTPAVRASSRQASPQLASQTWRSPHSRTSCSSLAWRPKVTTASNRVQGEQAVAWQARGPSKLAKSSLQKVRQHEGRQSLQPGEGNRQKFGIRALVGLEGNPLQPLQRFFMRFLLALKATAALTTTTSSHPLLLMVTAAPAGEQCQDLRSCHYLDRTHTMD